MNSAQLYFYEHFTLYYYVLLWFWCFAVARAHAVCFLLDRWRKCQCLFFSGTSTALLCARRIVFIPFIDLFLQICNKRQRCNITHFTYKGISKNKASKQALEASAVRSCVLKILLCCAFFNPFLTYYSKLQT